MTKFSRETINIWLKKELINKFNSGISPKIQMVHFTWSCQKWGSVRGKMETKTPTAYTCHNSLYSAYSAYYSGG